MRAPGREYGRGLRALVAAVCVCAIHVQPALAQTPDPGGDQNANVPVPPPGGKYFGLNEGIGPPAHNLAPGQLVGIADAAGANAIRTVLAWQVVEPTRDGWSDATWRIYDELYASARTRGITPILVLQSAPWWARTLLGKLCLSNHSCSYPPRPGVDPEWAQFAAEAARRYPDAVFQIWNEPNLSGFWESGPEPERYARLQVLAYDAIKRIRPDAMVLSAGFANVHRSDPVRDLLGSLLGRMGMREFVRRSYAAADSIKGHVDALAFHPYPGRPDGGAAALGPGSGFANGFADIRAVRDAAGDSETPLFLTETGLSTIDGFTRDQQATASVQLYSKALTIEDVAGVVFHRMLQPAGTDLMEAGFGWLHSPGAGLPQPWPVHCTFVAAAGNGYPGC